MNDRWTRIALLWTCLLFAAAAVGAAEVEVRPAEPSPGELFLVEVDGLPSEVVPAMHSGSKTFPMWPAGEGRWSGLVAVDRDEATPEVSVRVVDSAAGSETDSLLHELRVSLQSREYPEQRLQVSDHLVHLSEEDQRRASRENRQIRSTLARRSGERSWTSPFSLPVEGPVTSPFGVRRVYNGTPRSYHSGLDIAAPRGTPVAAASEGRVALAGDLFYTGNTVFLDHGLGLYSAYFHLDEAAVAEGDRVEAGAVIGTVGSTGRSTGPHLHWGVYLSGVKVDPLSLVQLMGIAAGGGESP